MNITHSHITNDKEWRTPFLAPKARVCTHSSDETRLICYSGVNRHFTLRSFVLKLPELMVSLGAISRATARYS